MKLVRIVLATASLVASLSMIPTAYADTKVAECAEFRNPTSSATATTITLRVDVYAKCTEEQLGRGKGQNPLYEMPDEESLFNLSSCTGPSITRLVGNGWLGTATCSLRIGSNTLPSPRVGATSTTIKMWFAWDFSTKSISVPHIAIPATTNNGWGGSSSGSSGGTSSGSNTPVAKDCTSAPNKPNLSIEWNSSGPKFNYSESSSGSKALLLHWSYALWNSNTRTWEDWQEWTSNTAGAGSYQSKLIDGKSKIAFAVYALNVCGSSEQTRESNAINGVPLEGTLVDEISYSLSVIFKPEIDSTLDIYAVAKSKLDLGLKAKSLSATNCTVSTDGKVKFLSEGDCVLEYTSVGSQNKIGSDPTRFTLFVKAGKAPQRIPDLTINDTDLMVGRSVSLNYVTSAGLDVLFESQSGFLCSVSGSTLRFLKSGSCALLATQVGNENVQEALPRNFNIWIPKEKTKTINCVKGKMTKKVMALSPKCPSGYKVKK